MATLTCHMLSRTAPAAMPSIFFFSGDAVLDVDNGQTATMNPSTMDKLFKGKFPWHLSFSYGKVLQKTCAVKTFHQGMFKIEEAWCWNWWAVSPFQCQGLHDCTGTWNQCQQLYHGVSDFVAVDDFIQTFIRYCLKTTYLVPPRWCNL